MNVKFPQLKSYSGFRVVGKYETTYYAVVGSEGGDPSEKFYFDKRKDYLHLWVGDDGIVRAQTEKPDVIVTDFQMPAMTGLEMIEELRKHDDMANVPVIMLTARGFAIEPEQMQKLKIFRCISKPFSPKDLLANVEEALLQNVTV